MIRLLTIHFLFVLIVLSGCSNKSHDQNPAQAHMHSHSIDQLISRFESPSRDSWQRPERVLDWIGPLQGQTVADIGAGSGYFTFRLVRRGAEVLALDIEPRFLEYIQGKANKADVELPIQTVLVSPGDPGFLPGSIDKAIIVDTYHHIDDRIGYLKKLHPAFRNGGRLVIVDFKAKETPVGPPVGIRLSRSQVKDELKQAGYCIRKDDQTILPYQYMIMASASCF